MVSVSCGIWKKTMVKEVDSLVYYLWNTIDAENMKRIKEFTDEIKEIIDKVEY